MLNESSGKICATATHVYHENEVTFIASIFKGFGAVSSAIGCKRPAYVSEEDFAVTCNIIQSVRLHWNGEDDDDLLFDSVEDMFDLHPEVVPWLQVFLQNGEKGEAEFARLIVYAHRILFQ